MWCSLEPNGRTGLSRYRQRLPTEAVDAPWHRIESHEVILIYHHHDVVLSSNQKRPPCGLAAGLLGSHLPRPSLSRPQLPTVQAAASNSQRTSQVSCLFGDALLKNVCNMVFLQKPRTHQRTVTSQRKPSMNINLKPSSPSEIFHFL